MEQQSDRALLERIDREVTAIRVVLLGHEGQGGLVRSAKEHKDDYYRFKRVVIGIFGFMVGSGALGLSVWRLLLV